jgi:tRNA uridine 5-carbamoylmethylation protein Kti12
LHFCGATIGLLPFKKLLIMIIRCIKNIKKHNIQFKKDEQCVITAINHNMVLISDLNYMRGMSINKEDLKKHFHYENI